MPDTQAVDQALFAKLSNDVTLTGLAPGGVYSETAPQGVSKPYVIVRQVDSDDFYAQGSKALEEIQYEVTGVDQSTSKVSVQAVANRIQALLQDVTLTITDYSCVNVKRIKKVNYTEIHAGSDRRYQHLGGLYNVLVEPT